MNNKEARSNVVSFLLIVFAGVFVVSFISFGSSTFVFSFDGAGITTVHSYSPNDSFGNVSTGGEGSSFINISLNNTLAYQSGNISQVSFTLPSTFTYTTNTNGSGPLGSNVSAGFSNTSNVLSWSNFTQFLINGSNVNISSFWFNFSATTPGWFNISMAVVNGTFTNYSNITIHINDTTVPAVSVFNSTSVISYGNYSGNVTFSILVHDFGNTTFANMSIVNETDVSANSTISWNKSGTAGWNFTIPTNLYSDGLYNITFFVNDSYGNVNDSVVFFQVRFDNIAPRVEDANFTNTGNYANLTNSLAKTLNITFHDTNSSTGAVVFNVTNSDGVQNGTYVGQKTGDYWWNNSMIITSHPDGTYNITAYVNDSAGNINSTARIHTIKFDSTAPSISLSSSAATKTSLTLTLSASDPTSGTRACSQDRPTATMTGMSSITETGLSCGTTYPYIVTCTDYAGNTRTSSEIPFTTTSCVSASTAISGSTGGTGGATSEKVISWSNIAPGELKVIEDIDEDAGIKQIELEVTEDVSNVKVTIKRYEEKPEEVAVAKSGTVYSYLEIETTNLDDKLAQATMTIQIKEDWLNIKNLDKDDMALFKFNGETSEWDELITTYTSTDEDYNYYEVIVDSFSFFAIGEKQAVIDEREEEEEIEILKTTNWVLWIVVGVLVLAGIVGGAVAIKKKGKAVNKKK
jgi:PGF-pre-PGF domain-containing protein